MTRSYCREKSRHHPLSNSAGPKCSSKMFGLNFKRSSSANDRAQFERNHIADHYLLSENGHLVTMSSRGDHVVREVTFFCFADWLPSVKTTL